ncbi:MAG: aldehyde ferredoxin oxidoreductase C-terminal domain-containing protein, partial [Thermodesulfobacteriota bacterium]
AGRVEALYLSGQLPIKNYLTNEWPYYREFTGQALRARFPGRPKPCWMCGVHCRWIDVPGLGVVEEPEYEAVAAMGPLIANRSVEGMIGLANLVDRLGLDVNEAGWLLAWVMEGYSEGWLSKQDLDGLEMTWGNTVAAAELLRKIAGRSGCGDWLAEGVMRAAQRAGEAGLRAAVGTKKGATPRTHDHRARWEELLDTCVSTTSTIEATGGYMDVSEIGLEPLSNRFSPDEVGRANARINGWRLFEDSCPICRFVSQKLHVLLDGVRAVTGWDLSPSEAVTIGKRAVNRLRVFNILHGVSPDLEAPSERYTSVVRDGPCAGADPGAAFLRMRQAYWREMGWDPDTGWPLETTLLDLGLRDEWQLMGRTCVS